MKRLLLTFAISAALVSVALAQFNLSAALYSEKETKTTMNNNIAIFFSARDAAGNRVGTYDGSTMLKPAVTRGMVLDGMIIPLNWDIKTFDLKFVPLEEARSLDVTDPNGWIVGRRPKGDLAFRYKIDTASLPNGDNIWVARVGWSDRKDHTAFLFVHWPSHSDGKGQQLLALVVREMPSGDDPLTGKNTADLRGIELYPYTEGFTNLVASPSGVPQTTTIPGQQVEKKVEGETEKKGEQGQNEEKPAAKPTPPRPAFKAPVSAFDIRSYSYTLSETRARTEEQKKAIKKQLAQSCLESDLVPAWIKDLPIPADSGRAILIESAFDFTVEFVSADGTAQSLPVEETTKNGRPTYSCLVLIKKGEMTTERLIVCSDTERREFTFTGGEGL